MALIATGLVIAAGLGLWQSFAAPGADDTAIAFNLPDLSGQQRQLSDWKGKVVLLNFWAPWCAPCRREIPMLKSVQKKYGARGLQVIGLAADNQKRARSYAAHAGIHYPVLLGKQAVFKLSSEYGDGRQALPYSVLINRRGRVVERQLGELERGQLRQWITRHLHPKPE